MPAMTVMISPTRKLPEVCWSFLSSRSRPKPASEAKTTPINITPTPASTVSPAGDVIPGASLNRPDPLKIMGSVTATEAPEPGEDRAGQGHADPHETQPAEHVGHSPTHGEQVCDDQDRQGHVAIGRKGVGKRHQGDRPRHDDQAR